MSAGRVRAVLELRPRPERHLMTVTRVGWLPVHVVAGPLLRRLHHSRQEPSQHCFIAHVISRGQNDPL